MYKLQFLRKEFVHVNNLHQSALIGLPQSSLKMSGSGAETQHTILGQSTVSSINRR